jgi:uncharacterized protein CbrC (UPF0167 family)
LAGRLEDAGLSTNDPDIAALREQLRDVEEPERARLASERTAELSSRTPHLVTWQDWMWPACCGDYVRFEGEVGRKELRGFARGGDGWQWLIDHLRDPLPKDLVESDLPPRASTEKEQWSLILYHFCCLHCARDLVLWDCD